MQFCSCPCKTDVEIVFLGSVVLGAHFQYHYSHSTSNGLKYSRTLVTASPILKPYVDRYVNLHSCRGQDHSNITSPLGQGRMG